MILIIQTSKIEEEKINEINNKSQYFKELKANL